MKTVIILRALPGAGKTTFANYLDTTSRCSSVVCSADDYFYDHNGNYNWDETKLHTAHKWCMELFENNLKDGTELIIISNTNYREKSVKIFKNLAEEYDYTVISTVLENRHGNKSVHNVDDKSLKKMRNAMIQNMKL